MVEVSKGEAQTRLNKWSDEFLEEKGKAGREKRKVERKKAKKEKKKKKNYFEVDDGDL